MKPRQKGKVKNMSRKFENTAGKVLAFGLVIACVAVLALIITGAIWGVVEMWRKIGLRPAEPTAEEPAEGVAWIMPEAGSAAVWMSPVCADQADTARLLEEYTEGDAPVPEWWNPDEEMAVEWQAAEPHPPEGIDPGGVDWNLCTTVWGWDGHGAEAWELDLYSRIVYLEFWGTSRECCEAGADSILRLWESEYFGDTLGGVLSARAENGSLVYTTYGFVWDAEYDPDGLADMRELCEERFMNGPEWGAEFFQLYGFPDWAVPCYEIDGVYFSTGKGW